MIFVWMVVQIIIESLPISSSGHVLLAEKIASHFGYHHLLPDSWIVDFLLHGPALVIMLCYFFSAWWLMVVHKPFKISLLSALSTYRLMVQPIIFILAADLVTFAWWYSNIAQATNMRSFLPVGFLCTALMLYGSKFLRGDKKISWSLCDGAILGFFQGVALLPGISRFATTFFVGRYLGYSGQNSFALSFLIQLPLVCAAFCKGMITVLADPMLLVQFFHFWMLFGIVGMSFVSYKLLCFVGYLIQHNRLWYFAWYMILPIMITLLL